MNPNPYGTGLSLNISEESNDLNLELAMEVIEDFRIDKAKAEKLILDIKTTVSKWPVIAKHLRISTSEQDRMAQAFLSHLR
jgi:serine/threonine-protein kinase HipA